MIELAGAGVRYRLPRTGIRSIKEFALLSLRRRVVFDDFWALKQVHLSVLPGERLGIVGRNGAGKSTLMQVIARVVAPTAGAVEVHGRVAPLLQLGAGFDTELTGRENVFLNGSLLGMSRAEITARFNAIVDFAELHEFIDVPLRAYSSGMAARLGFAVATASDPKILLLDEVLAVGDEAFKAKCLARMREFTDRGTTMVLVTHDPELVLEQCTRALWIEAGRVRAEGAPAAVLEAYHSFLAGRMPTATRADPEAGLSARPDSVAPSGNVTVRWTVGSRPDDWIGLFKVGDPSDEPHLIDWRRIDGSWGAVALTAVPSGSCDFEMPPTAGSYEFRFFAGDTYTVAATSDPVTVVPPMLRASLSNPASGGAVVVTWTNSSRPNDWIGLFAAGAPADEANLLDWAYVNCDRGPTSVVPAGSREFRLPGADGRYEFRLFAGGTYTLLATSNAVATPATLRVNPGSVAPDGVASVSWTGSSSSSDWIGLFPVGAPADEANLLDWAYVNCDRGPTSVVPAGSREFRLPGADGRYEFRLFAGGTYTLLATSNAVAVPGR